jgi:hypothetical protein
MGMQITTAMVGAAAQIVVQAAVAAIAVAVVVVIISEEHMIQNLRVMMEVAVIRVVKTSRNNIGMDFGVLPGGLILSYRRVCCYLDLVMQN